jgi:hypothetical protein
MMETQQLLAMKSTRAVSVKEKQFRDVSIQMLVTTTQPPPLMMALVYSLETVVTMVTQKLEMTLLTLTAIAQAK